MTIKNIIFDLGGVIADFDFKSMTQGMVALGLPLPSTLTQSKEPMTSLAQLGPIADMINKMDRGDLSGMEFIQYMLQGCRPGTQIEEVVSVYNHLLIIPRERIEWIRSLRSKYRILLLSNIGDLHWQYFQHECARQGVPVEEMFDDIYVSYQLHTAKPEPAIFEHLISDSGIEPAATLYIDDNAANIEMGAHYGLQARLIASNSLTSDSIAKLFGGEE